VEKSGGYVLTFYAPSEKRVLETKAFYDPKLRISLTGTTDKLINVTCRLYSLVAKPAPNGSI